MDKWMNEGCSWPTVLNRTRIRDCAFPWDKASIRQFTLSNRPPIVVATLPIGTRLFHATRTAQTRPWFLKEAPKNEERGAVWFASTAAHLNMIEDATHHICYTLKRPLTLVFQKHIRGIGYDFISHFLTIGLELHQQYKIEVDGYASCSECEVALLNQSIETAFDRTARVKQLH